MVLKGTVKEWKVAKGFGFIMTSDESPEDVFVHQSELKMEGYRCLSEGEKVGEKTETIGKI